MADFLYQLPIEFFSSLDQTTPELQRRVVYGGGGHWITLRTNKPPLDNVDIRRALMIGTDMKTFADAMGAGPLPIHWFPVDPSHPAYIPLEELPADIRILYDYDPDLAIQMLADAEYPFGTLKLECLTYDIPSEIDYAALLKSEWAKIGVTCDIKPLAPAAYYVPMRDDTMTGIAYVDMFLGRDPTQTLSLNNATGGTGEYANNAAMWVNEYYDELLIELSETEDKAERNRLFREMTLEMLRDVPYIPAGPTRVEAFAYWPWIANYYGELTDCKWDLSNLLARVWIDQDMKKSMGYR